MSDFLEVSTVEQIVSSEQEVVEVTTVEQVVLTERVVEQEMLETPTVEQLIVTPDDEFLVTEVPIHELLEVAVQGPPGPQGAPGFGAAESVIRDDVQAATHLNAFYAVYIAADGARYASNDDVPTARACVGITNEEKPAGQLVAITTFGRLRNPAWSWAPGPVYLGVGGSLTQTPPVKNVVEVGVFVAPTEIEVRVRWADELETDLVLDGGNF